MTRALAIVAVIALALYTGEFLFKTVATIYALATAPMVMGAMP